MAMVRTETSSCASLAAMGQAVTLFGNCSRETLSGRASLLCTGALADHGITAGATSQLCKPANRVVLRQVQQNELSEILPQTFGKTCLDTLGIYYYDATR